MIVLGFETTAALNSVAVWNDEGLLAEMAIRNCRDLCRRLPGLVDNVFHEAGLGGYQELGGVAVSAGPGSFTGIRVGLSYARTLAQALDLPLASIPTLAAAAVQASSRPGQTLVSLIPCRQEYVYCQAFTGVDAEVRPLSEPEVVPFDRAAAHWRHHETPVHWCGEAVDAHRDALLEWAPADTLVPPGGGIVTAGTIAKIGWRMIRAGTAGDWQTAEPLYLAASAAERKLATPPG